jgi:hypothetical protein
MPPMAGTPKRPTDATDPAIYSRMAVHVVEAAYRRMGADNWNSRKVMRLCGKTVSTPEIMAARLRITPSQFERRMRENSWTKQDGLILSLIEQEIDILKSGIGRQQTPEAVAP